MKHPFHKKKPVRAGSKGLHTYIGIDPGVNGAVADLLGLINTRGRAAKAHNMPETEGDLWDLIIEYKGRPNPFAFIEQQAPRPTCLFDRKTRTFKNVILKSTCVLYGNYMQLRQALTAAGIPYEEITPARWQRGLNIPPRKKKEPERKWKNRLKKKAQQLFPELKVTLKNCDALLIAVYCQRVNEGIAK